MGKDRRLDNALSGPDPYDPIPDKREWHPHVEIEEASPGWPVEVPLHWLDTCDPEGFKSIRCSRYRACLAVAYEESWEAWGCFGCNYLPEDRDLLDPAGHMPCKICGRILDAGTLDTCSRDCATRLRRRIQRRC